MKNLFAVLILFALTTLSCKVLQKPNSVNGTYELVSKTVKKGDDVYGYAGEIQVKEVPNNKIVLSFFITKGAPSYNSGSFVDTMDLANNLAIYTNKEFDPSCKITLQFTVKGIQLKQESNHDYFECGFGNGVVAHGFFKRVSSEVPVIKDLATGEEWK